MADNTLKLVEIISKQIKILEDIGIDPRTHVPLTFGQLKILIEFIYQLLTDSKNNDNNS